MGSFRMSKEELESYEIIRNFLEGFISRYDAARKLNISERSVTNRANKIRKKGVLGAHHGNKGKPPKIKKSQHTKHRYISKKKNQYFDFNVHHAWEMIQEEAGSSPKEEVSYCTFYRWCKAESLLKFKSRRRKKARALRNRMPRTGMMIQMDGSHHFWNGTEEWCLMTAIDDANSELVACKFYSGETTLACLDMLFQIVSTKGLPEYFYIDRAAWGGGFKRIQNNFSQFEEVCKGLGIQIIYANSPQAKGRVERANRTHQDRLIPLLRLHKIKTIPDANIFIQRRYIAEWNKKYSVPPTEEKSSYIAMPNLNKLKEITCAKEAREVRADGCISWCGAIFQCRTQEGFPLIKGGRVEIRRYPDGTWNTFHNGKEVRIKIVPSNRQPNPKFLQNIPPGNKEIQKQIDDLDGKKSMKA